MTKKLFSAMGLSLCLFLLLGISINAQSDKNINLEAQSEIQQKISAINEYEIELLKLPVTNEIADKLETIQAKRDQLMKANQLDPAVVVQQKKSNQNDSALSLFEQAQKLNQEYASKGIPFKTQLKTIGGKQFIELVELPKQDGIVPTKK